MCMHLDWSLNMVLKYGWASPCSAIKQNAAARFPYCSVKEADTEEGWVRVFATGVEQQRVVEG